jgi:hypothetical protein
VLVVAAKEGVELVEVLDVLVDELLVDVAMSRYMASPVK